MFNVGIALDFRAFVQDPGKATCLSVPIPEELAVAAFFIDRVQHDQAFIVVRLSIVGRTTSTIDVSQCFRTIWRKLAVAWTTSLKRRFFAAANSAACSRTTCCSALRDRSVIKIDNVQPFYMAQVSP